MGDSHPDSHPGLRGLNARELLSGALNSLGEQEDPAAWTPPAPADLARYFPAYEIVALLGRGGMGAVYRARQRSLDRWVAIKLLPFSLGVREDFANRFQREASALARLSHPAIVAVHDFGQAADGHWFIVMEYVEGKDLATLMREGPLPPERAIEIVRQICDAVEYAHEAGVVHRDIKPGNILLEARGRVRVMDFGLAQFMTDDGPSLTRTGTAIGTPEYVAPEQLQGTSDHRSDIYSLGVMLYELLTGTLPRGIFTPVSKVAPAVAGLDRVITRALQSDPNLRYARVRELREALAEPARARRGGKRNPRLAGAVAVILLFVTGLALWWASPKQRAPGGNEELTNSIGQRLVPAGTPGVLFSVHEVRVRDFARFVEESHYQPERWMYDTDERGEWRRHAEVGWDRPAFLQTPDHPVVGVSWVDAQAYCRWLTARERDAQQIGLADRYRLPTDQEWRVAAGLPPAAKAAPGEYLWGVSWPPFGRAGNFAGEELLVLGWKLPVISGYRDAFTHTAPVGSFSASASGLYDLMGNVWEWLEDDVPGGQRWLLGGAWFEGRREWLSAAYRAQYTPETRGWALGFRVVLARSGP